MDKKILLVFLAAALITLGFLSYLLFKKQPPTFPDVTLPSFEEIKNSHFGFMHPEHAYKYGQEVGVHWQRPHPGPFIWGDLEPTRGNYSWTKADRYIQESQRYGFVVMATIWSFANWDQQACHSKLPNLPRKDFPELGDYRGKPCDMTAYREFVIRLVERYDGDGEDDMKDLIYPIKYWEVGNEPSLRGELTFFQGTPADYFELLKTTYQAVKKSDQTAKVLQGGMAGLSEEEIEFWQEVLDLGGADYFDIANHHSVSGPFDLHIPEMKAFMAKNKIQKPLWITEVEFKAWGIGEDELSQDEWAVHLVKSFVYAFGEGVSRLFYVGLDESPGDENTWLVNCGMKERKFFEPEPKSCQKQAPFYAFQTLAAKIDYFTKVEKLAKGRFKFIVDNKPVYALWGKGKLPSEITGRVKVTDIRGGEEAKEAGQIVLGDSPIFVESENPVLELPIASIRGVTGVQAFHNPDSPQLHSGFDFTLPKPTKIFSPVAGEITDVHKFRMSNGYWIVDVNIKINSKWTTFIAFEPCTKAELVIDRQLSKIVVKKGDAVKQGQLLGILDSVPGSEFPHIHWQVQKLDEPVSPYDYCSKSAKAKIDVLCDKFDTQPGY